MIIWGNHSPTMYPDVENALVGDKSVGSIIDDMNWVKNNFLPTVQQRGKAVIDARGASSATSAAKAALDTIIACENVTEPGDCFSAAVASDGAYDVPEGLICGYPLMTLEDGSVEIIRDVTLSKFAKEKFLLSIAELESEREAVKNLL
jgi:malate dehydrogenase